MDLIHFFRVQLRLIVVQDFWWLSAFPIAARGADQPYFWLILIDDRFVGFHGDFVFGGDVVKEFFGLLFL